MACDSFIPCKKAAMLRLKIHPLIPVFSLLALLAGCGMVFVNKGSKNEPLTDGLMNPSEFRAKVVVSAEQKIIGNFEDGTERMNPKLYGSSDGLWMALSFAGNTVNNPFIVPGGANGTGMAAHIFGVLVNKGDGSYPAFRLTGKLKMGGYYDASSFDGVRFYYKCPSDDKSVNRRFSIPIAATVPTSDGGTCVDGCYNHFEKDLSPTDGWVQVKAPFKDLQRQPYWGSPVTPPEFIDHLKEIVNIEWDHDAANTKGKYNIDYWVDEVEFY